MIESILHFLGMVALAVIVIGFAFWETTAILTNWFPTLSEIIWALQKRNKWIKLLIRVVLVWGFIHLWFGECAFGMCCDRVLEPVCFWR